MGTCPTCGGVNGFLSAEVVNTINTGAPNPWAFVCTGHAEPEPRHDGNLGEDTTVLFDMKQVAIIGYMRGMALTPKQALSLLTWLEQEKPALEKMAGVEKDEAKGVDPLGFTKKCGVSEASKRY